MPIAVKQRPDQDPGWAGLSLAKAGHLAATPDQVQICIGRMDLGTTRFLDPRQTGDEAWGSGESWIRPDRVAPEGAEGLSLLLGPAVTWHLKPHQPYMVSLRDGIGAVVEDRMLWPPIRLPSEAPPPSQSDGFSAPSMPPLPGAPATEAESVPDPVPVPDPIPDVAADPVIAPQPIAQPASPVKKSASPLLGLGLLVGMLVAGAVVFFYFLDPQDDQTAQEDPAPVEETAEAPATPDAPPPDPAENAAEAPETTLGGARTYLATRPTAAEAEVQRQRFVDAGETDGAFLLGSYAARQGDPDAALWMGRQYDPEGFSEGVIDQPDPDRAAGFYEQAAKAGKAEAMLRLGSLMQSGQVSVDNAPEQAEFWLRRAREEGLTPEGAGQ
ncbi:MAG: hypothetical protein ACPGOY_09020 [Rhodospirillaceae bacterium]